MVISILILAAAIAFLAYGAIRMTNVTQRLIGSVAALTNVSASAVALIGGLAQAIRDNAEDPAALNELADQIDQDTANLANAITLNTPVATAPGVQSDPTVPPPSTPAPEGDETGSAGEEGSDTVAGGDGNDTADAGAG